MLVLAILVLCSHASAQATAGGSPASVVDRVDASVGFNFIRSNAPPGGCQCFNAVGGYGSVGYHITNWISLQGEVTGQHSNDIGTLGQNLTLITYAGGPRVSLPGRRFVPFAQALFGQARATDSYFPNGNGGSTTSANSFALLAGGGLDYNLSRHFGIRAINVEYLRTTFPNGSDNTQNHLSLGAGVIFRFGNRNSGPRYVTAPPPPPKPTLKMVCSADVQTVDQGNTIEISAKTIIQPEDLPVSVTWAATQGRLVGSGPRVLLDTAGVPAGEYAVRGQATASASRQLSAECVVHFRVKSEKETMKAPAPPPAGPPPDADREREFHQNVPDALFDYNSAVIRPDTQAAIDHAKLYLDQHPDIRVLLGGFADDRGSVEYNLKLGMKRAVATRDAMIAAGIAPERLQIVTYGKGVQLCTDSTENCRQQNRRVMFSIHP